MTNLTFATLLACVALTHRIHMTVNSPYWYLTYIVEETTLGYVCVYVYTTVISITVVFIFNLSKLSQLTIDTSFPPSISSSPYFMSYETEKNSQL